MAKRVLIVSPHFPPVNAPDLQRVRMSLPHYAALGWEAVVLTVHPDDVAAPKETALMDTLPAGLRIVTCRAWSLETARKFGLGTLGLRAWLALFRAGDRLLRSEHFDLVFFSTAQMIVQTAGPLWLRRHGVPYVIDLQDPWRTDYYKRPGAPPPPGGWKYALSRILARLEGPTFRRASGFMSVSPGYIAALEERYPWFRTKPRRVIPFGVSMTDVETAHRLPPGAHALCRHPGEVHIGYTGVGGAIMGPAVRVLFSAVRALQQAEPAAAARLRFHFFGTSYAPDGRSMPSVLPVAESYGVAHLVTERSGRIGHLESLAVLLHCDALLILGTDDPAYTPSKVLPYYALALPILAIAYPGSQLERQMENLRCARIAPLTQGEPSRDAHRVVIGFLTDALAGFPEETRPVRNDPWFHQHASIERLVHEQVQVFDEALAGRGPR